MGLILDTDVLIRAEKAAEPIDFRKWSHHSEAFISAITCSELLVGVHLANTQSRRLTRAAFVERLLGVHPHWHSTVTWRAFTHSLSPPYAQYHARCA